MPYINGKYVFQTTDNSNELVPLENQNSNPFDSFVSNYSKSSQGNFENPVKRFNGYLDEYSDYVNTSTTPLSSDWGELRALSQSNAERFGNGLVKFGGNAAITFLDGTVGVLTGLAALADGNDKTGFIDNPFSNKLHELSNAMNEEFANYETNEYKNSGITKAFSMQFFADGLLASAGFMAGAMAGGGLISAPIRGITKAGIKSVLKTAGRNVDDVIGAVKSGKKLTEAVNGLSANTVSKIAKWDAAGQLTGSALSSIGEARIEALDGKERVKNNLIQSGQWDNMSEQEREEALSDTEKSIFLGNMAMLTAGNFVQFGKMFSNGYTPNKIFNNIKLNKGVASVNKPTTRAGKVLEFSKNAGSVLKAPITEGLEEQGQYFIGETSNYYNSVRSKDPNANHFYNSLVYGLGETNTTDGWLNFVAGAVMGGVGPNFNGGKKEKDIKEGDKKESWFKKANFAGGIRDAIKERREGNIKSEAKAQEINAKIKESLGMKLGSQMEELKALMGAEVEPSTERVQKIKTLRSGIIATFSAMEDQSKAAANGDKKSFQNAKAEGNSILYSTLMETGLLDQYESDLNDTLNISEQELRDLFKSNITSTNPETGEKEDIEIDPNVAVTSSDLMEMHRKQVSEQLNQIKDARTFFNKIQGTVGDRISPEGRVELMTLMHLNKNADSRIESLSKKIKDSINLDYNVTSKKSTSQLEDAYDLVRGIMGYNSVNEMFSAVGKGEENVTANFYRIVDDLSSNDKKAREAAFKKIKSAVTNKILNEVNTDSDGLGTKELSEDIKDLAEIAYRRDSFSKNIKAAFSKPEGYSENINKIKNSNEKVFVEDSNNLITSIQEAFPFVKKMKADKAIEESLKEYLLDFFNDVRQQSAIDSLSEDGLSNYEISSEKLLEEYAKVFSARTVFNDWTSFLKTTFSQDNLDVNNKTHELAFLYFMHSENADDFYYITQTINTVNDNLKDTLKFFIPATENRESMELTYNEIVNHPTLDKQELFSAASEQIRVVPVNKTTKKYAYQDGILVSANLPDPSFKYREDSSAENSDRFEMTEYFEAITAQVISANPNKSPEEIADIAKERFKQKQTEELSRYNEWREKVKDKATLLNFGSINPGAKNNNANEEEINLKEEFGKLDPKNFVPTNNLGGKTKIVNGYKLIAGLLYYKHKGSFRKLTPKKVNERDAKEFAKLILHAYNNQDDFVDVNNYLSQQLNLFYNKGEVHPKRMALFTDRVTGKFNRIVIGEQSFEGDQINTALDQIAEFIATQKTYNAKFSLLTSEESYNVITVANNRLTRKPVANYLTHLVNENRFTVSGVKLAKDNSGNVIKQLLVKNSPTLNMGINFVDTETIVNQGAVESEETPINPSQSIVTITNKDKEGPLYEKTWTTEGEWDFNLSINGIIEGKIEGNKEQIKRIQDQQTTVENRILGLQANLNDTVNQTNETINLIENQIKELEKQYNIALKSKSKSAFKNQTKEKIEELKRQVRSQLLIPNQLLTSIKVLQEEVKYLDRIKQDLFNQVKYYNNLKAQGKVSKESLEKEIKVINSKINTVSKLIDKLKKLISKGLFYIKGFVNQFKTVSKELNDFISNSGFNKLTLESNYGELSTKYKEIQSRVIDSIDDIEMLEKAKEADEKRLTELVTLLENLNNNKRYIESILNDFKEDAPKSSEEFNNALPISTSNTKPGVTPVVLPSTPVVEAPVITSVNITTSISDKKAVVEIISENYTPELLKANPDKLFLFGDNNTRTGKGGQAIIRDEPNAAGISTKLLPKNTQEAFMSDDQLANNKAVIDSDIKKAKEKATKEGKTIVLPKGGFGTGLAALATKAPKTFEYLNRRLQEEFGFNNTTGELTATTSTSSIEAQKADVEKRKPFIKGIERINAILDGSNQLDTEKKAIEILNEVHRFRKNHKKNGLATKEELAQMDKFEQEAKDNFGLEIVSQLGKKYDERGNIDVINFNTIENSQGDERIIIAEIKPQINKNGVLAQRANVDVLQGLSRQQFDAELAALEGKPVLETPKQGGAKPTPEVNATQQKTLFRAFEKAFYEGNNKRYDDISDEKLAELTPATREYLLNLYETLKPFNSTFQILDKIIDKQTSKEITTEDQKIKYVTSSYFGGLGRGSSELGSSTDPKHKNLVLPVPTANVLNNINQVFGAKLTDTELATSEDTPVSNNTIVSFENNSIVDNLIQISESNSIQIIPNEGADKIADAFEKVMQNEPQVLPETKEIPDIDEINYLLSAANDLEVENLDPNNSGIPLDLFGLQESVADQLPENIVIPEIQAPLIEESENNAPQSDIDEANKLFNRIENTRSDSISSEERAWFSKVFTNGVIEEVEGLIDNLAVGRAIAGGKLLLSNLAKSGTIYHEGFHFLTELFPKESAAAFKNLRKRLGDKIVRVQSGDTFVNKKGKDLTDKEANEYLAYNFESYALGESVNIPQAAEKTLFDKIKAFLEKMLLAIGIKTKLNEETTIEQLYEFFLNAKNLDITNTTNNTFSYNKIEGFDASLSNKIMTSVNASFFEFLANRSTNSLPGDPLFRTYPSVEDMLNYDFSEGVYNDFKIYFSKTKKEQYDFLTKENTTYWDNAIKEHQSILASYKIEIFDDVIDEDLSDDLQVTNDLSTKPQGSIDYTTKVPSFIRLAILSLPAVSSNNTVLGMANYSKILNLFLNTLTNTPGIDNKLQKLNRLAISYPEIQPIIASLSLTNTKEELFFRMTFEQFFNKNKEDVSVVLVDNGVTAVDSVMDNLMGKYLDNWKELIKESPSTKKITNGDVIFKITESQELANKFNSLVTDNEKVLFFFKEFGLDIPNYVLDRVLDPANELVDKIALNAYYIINDISKQTMNGKEVGRTSPLKVEDLIDSKKIKSSGRLKEIAKLVASVDDLTYSPTYKEADGSNGYSVGLFTNIDIIIDKIKAGTIRTLNYLKPFKQLNTLIEGNPSAYYSKWLNSGTKSIVVETFKGLQNTEKGKSLSKLSMSEYLVGKLAMAYKTSGRFGSSYNRPSDRPIDKIIYAPSKATVAAELTSLELLDYVKSELLTMLVGSTGVAKEVAYRNIEEFTIFDFLNDKLNVKELLGKANSEDFITLVEKFVEDNKDVIIDEINNKVKEEVDSVKVLLLDNQIFQNAIIDDKPVFVFSGIDYKTMTNYSSELAPSLYNKPVAEGEKSSETVYYYTSTQLDKFVNHFVGNSIISSIEQSILITGNPGFYKKYSQYNKRTTLFAATRYQSLTNEFDIYMDTHYPRLDGRLRSSDNNVRKITFKDIKKKSDSLNIPAYQKDMEVSDAQTWVMPDHYREVLLKSNIQHWSKDVEKSWIHTSQKNMIFFVKKGVATEEDFRKTFSEHLPDNFEFNKDWETASTFYNKEKIKQTELLPLNAHKTQFMGAGSFSSIASGIDSKGKDYNIGGMFVPDSLKSAEQIISIEDFSEDSPIMQFALQAYKDGIDMLTFNSTAKGAKFPGQDFYTTDNEGNQQYIPYDKNLTTQIGWDFYGVQQEIEKKYKDSVVYSSQIRNQIIADINVMFDKQNMTDSQKELVNLANKYVELNSKRIERLYKDLVQKLGLDLEIVTEEFRERLMQAIDSKDLTFDVLEGVKSALSKAPYSLDTHLYRQKIENIMNSFFRSEVIAKKVNGDAYVQASIAGSGIPLKTYINTEESTMLSECAIQCPVSWYKHLTSRGISLKEFNNLLRTNREKAYKLIGKDLLEMVNNRIPCQAANLIEGVQIVHLFPPNTGNKIVLPEEHTTKTGSDFDVDKLLTYINNHYNDRGALKSYEMYTLENKEKLFDQFVARKEQEVTKAIKEDNSFKSFNSRFINSKAEYDSLENLFKDFKQDIFNKVGVFTGETNITSLNDSITALKEYKVNTKDAVNDIEEKINSKYWSNTEFSDLLNQKRELLAKIKNANELLTEIHEQINMFKSNSSDANSKIETAKKAIMTRMNNISNNYLQVYREEFDNLSIDELNTPMIIDNEINNVAKNIIKNPEFFKQLMTGTDEAAGKLKDIITEGEPSKEGSSFFTLMTPSHNINLTMLYNAMGANIGITANMQAGLGIRQFANLKWPGQNWLNPDNLNGNHVLGNKYAYEKKGKKITITEIQSGLMTGFIDLGTDDFITSITSTNDFLAAMNFMFQISSNNESVADFSTIIKMFKLPQLKDLNSLISKRSSMVIPASDIPLSQMITDFLNSYGADDLQIIEESTNVLDVDARETAIKVKEEYLTAYGDLEGLTKKAFEGDTDSIGKVLALIVYYREQGKILNKVEEATRPDRSMPMNMTHLMVSDEFIKYVSNKLNLDSSDIEGMFSKTYIGAFAESRRQAYKGFSKLFVNSHPKLDTIYKDLISAKMSAGSPNSKIVEEIDAVKQDYINYVVGKKMYEALGVNEEARQKVFNSLFEGPLSMNKMLPMMRKANPGNKALELLSIINAGYSKGFKVRFEQEFIKVASKRQDVYQGNEINNFLHDLYVKIKSNKASDLEKRFMNSLIPYLMGTSGTKYSTESIQPFILSTVYQSTVSPIIETLYNNLNNATEEQVKEAFNNFYTQMRFHNYNNSNYGVNTTYMGTNGKAKRVVSLSNIYKKNVEEKEAIIRALDKFKLEIAASGNKKEDIRFISLSPRYLEVSTVGMLDPNLGTNMIGETTVNQAPGLWMNTGIEYTSTSKDGREFNNVLFIKISTKGIPNRFLEYSDKSSVRANNLGTIFVKDFNEKSLDKMEVTKINPEINSENTDIDMSNKTYQVKDTVEKVEVPKIDQLNKGQKTAVEKAMTLFNKPVSKDLEEDMFLLSGKGGTGKSFSTEIIIDEYKKLNPRDTVMHVAPTWNAVNEVLKANSDPDYKAHTLASFLQTDLSAPDSAGNRNFILKSKKDVELMIEKGYPPLFLLANFIVIDEASMIGGNNQEPIENAKGDLVQSDTYKALLVRLKLREELGYGRPRKIMFVGDYAQTVPVGVLEDRDSYIIDKLMDNPDQHYVLTENMRTNKNDLHILHEKYRTTIDVARASIKKGIKSNDAIGRTIDKFVDRKNSENITYLKNINESVKLFAEIFALDYMNVTNVVFGNYNNQNRQESLELTKAIRKELFGQNASEKFNNKELVLLNGNFKTNNFTINNKKENIVFHNETRFSLSNVKNNLTETVNLNYSTGWGRNKTSKSIKVNISGSRATLNTQVGKNTGYTEAFIPNEGEFDKILGKYSVAKKGYIVNGEVIPYGDAIKFKESFVDVSYAYVVNSHKVQGATYNYTFMDEGNILKSPQTNKEVMNSTYTISSRPKNELFIYNQSNPALDNNKSLWDTHKSTIQSKDPNITKELFDSMDVFEKAKLVKC